MKVILEKKIRNDFVYDQFVKIQDEINGNLAKIFDIHDFRWFSRVDYDSTKNCG